MSDLPGAALVEHADDLVAALRAAGAVFAFVHGSRAAGTHRPGSDTDVAAWFDGADPPSWEVDVPHGVDLLVLDQAPLELAGRVALHGALLLDDDPPKRVAWQADTRLIYLDEAPFQAELRRIFFEAHRGR